MHSQGQLNILTLKLERNTGGRSASPENIFLLTLVNVFAYIMNRSAGAESEARSTGHTKKNNQCQL